MEVIDLSKCDSSNNQIESPEFTIYGQNVYKNDLQILKSAHEWLKERLITAEE